MVESSFSFFIIGETHGFIDDFNKEEAIILQIKPEFVLSEQLQDLVLDSPVNYNKLFEQKIISNMVPFKEVEKLLILCRNNNIKLIGIDFKNFGLNKRLQGIVKGKLKSTQKDLENIKFILKKREIHHINTIKKYLCLSRKPIIVLIGAWHLRRNSVLMKSLNNFKAIYPCDPKNRLLTKPIKNTKLVRYCEYIKNDKKNKN